MCASIILKVFPTLPQCLRALTLLKTNTSLLSWRLGFNSVVTDFDSLFNCHGRIGRGTAFHRRFLLQSFLIPFTSASYSLLSYFLSVSVELYVEGSTLNDIRTSQPIAFVEKTEHARIVSEVIRSALSFFTKPWSAVPSSSHEMYHRAYPSIRSVPSSSNLSGTTNTSPRLAPLLPPSGLHGLSPKSTGLLLNQHLNAALPETAPKHPTICGMPLKYVS